MCWGGGGGCLGWSFERVFLFEFLILIWFLKFFKEGRGEDKEFVCVVVEW